MKNEPASDAISSACYYHTRNICRAITGDTFKTLAHALVTSRLDYDNPLIYGLLSTPMERV